MTDLSSLSDADLANLYAGTANSPTAAMTNEQLQAAYASSHPVAGPSGSESTDWGRKLGTAAANTLAGLVSMPRTLASGVDWLGNKVGVNVGADAALAGMHDPTDASKPAFPDFQTARNMAFNTTGGTEYQPQTWAGRRTIDALTGAMGGAAAGPAAIIPSAAAGAGAGQGAETFPNHPLAAALIGALAGGKVGQVAQNAPQRLSAMGSVAEPYGAFVRQGLPTDLVGTSTGAPTPSWAQKYAARMPGSEGAVADAQHNLIDAWQQRFDQITGRLGNASTPTEAGTSLQQAAQNWVQQFRGQSDQAWNAFRSLVPANTQIGVGNFRQALDGVLGDYGGADNLAKVLQPQLAAQLKGALGADLKGGQTLPWQSVQSVRSALGEMLEGAQPIEGASKTAVRRLYGALSDDMSAGVQNAGPQAQQVYALASQLTRQGHDVLDSTIQPILSKGTPEEAAQWALAQARQGATRLQGVTAALPSAAGDLGSYALRNASGNPQNPSASALATALTGRRPTLHPDAVQALAPDAQTQADIADMATTGRQMQPFEKDLANSPTATHSIRGEGRIIAAVELARQGHELAGLPGAVGGAALGLAGPSLTGRAAQATALNPYVAALYGRNIPLPAVNAPLMSRYLIARGVQPQLAGPATSPNLPTQ